MASALQSQVGMKTQKHPLWTAVVLIAGFSSFIGKTSFADDQIKELPSVRRAHEIVRRIQKQNLAISDQTQRLDELESERQLFLESLPEDYQIRLRADQEIRHKQGELKSLQQELTQTRNTERQIRKRIRRLMDKFGQEIQYEDLLRTMSQLLHERPEALQESAELRGVVDDLMRLGFYSRRIEVIEEDIGRAQTSLAQLQSDFKGLSVDDERRYQTLLASLLEIQSHVDGQIDCVMEGRCRVIESVSELGQIDFLRDSESPEAFLRIINRETEAIQSLNQQKTIPNSETPSRVFEGALPVIRNGTTQGARGVRPRQEAPQIRIDLL